MTSAGEPAVAPAAADAPTTDDAVYAYDATGRLVGVSDPDGETARYRFDEAGNRLGVDRFASSTLSVLSLVPVRAKAGGTVTLSGTGFASTAASNSVKFGSVQAQVVTASVTRLEVKVPAGAGAGKVSVTAGGVTVASPETFTLAASGPSLTAIAPVSGLAGAQVTLTGTGFASVRTDNVVRFAGGAIAQVTARTDTSLTVKVPPGAVSGPVEVSTADGSAKSSATFAMLSGGTSEFETTVTTSVSDEAPPTVAVTTPGNKARVLFDGDAGQDISFGLSRSTFNSTVTVRLLDPQGVQVDGTSIPATGGDWDVRDLPLGGRYSLDIEPGASNIGSATVTVSTTTGGSLDFIAPALQTPITRPGQDGRWSFTGSMGQSLSIGFASSGFTKALAARLYGPDGKQIVQADTNIQAGSAGSFDIDALTQSGEYVLIVDPDFAGTGTVSVTASTYAQLGVLDSAGPAANLVIARQGQDGRAEFTAQAGQRFQLWLQTSGSISSFKVGIYRPDGTPLYESSVLASTAREWDSPALPATGTYTITVSPDKAGTGTIAMTLSRSLEVAQLAPAASPVLVELTRPAQNAESVFQAQSGDDLSLGITKNTFTKTVYLSVIAPSGKTVIDGQFITAGADATVVLPDLAESGTYLVVANPYQGATGTLLLTLSSDVKVSLATDGAATAISVVRAGQRATGTFTATAGDDLSVGVTGNTFTKTLYASVVAPSGKVVVDKQYLSAGADNTVGLPNLPESGSYLVTLEPFQAGVGSVNVTLSTDAHNTLAADTASVSAHAPRPGQRIQAEFTAADTSLGFAITDNTVAKSTEVYLVTPAGTQSSLGSVSGKTAGTKYLTGLTPGAAYTLILQPFQAATGDLKMWLSTPVQAGTPTATTAASGTVNRPGQPLEFKYTAAAGDGAAIRFSGTPAGSSTIALVTPDGAVDTNASSFSSGSGEVDLLGALTAGAHRVLLNPDQAITAPVTISGTLVPDRVAGSLTIGGAKLPAAITAAAQNGRFTFNGTKDQLLTVAVDAPPYPWYLSVRGPDGKLLVDERYLGNTTLTTALPKLPVSGVYTVTADPNGLATGTINLGIKTTGTLATTQTTPITGAKAAASVAPQPAVVPSGPDAWQPGQAQLAGRDWLTARGDAPKAPQRLRAPPGKTALTGRVLKLDGTPLANVTVTAGTRTVHTDGQGRFLLAGISDSTATVVVDGASANTAERQYGRFDIHVQPTAGTTTDLGFPVWMTPLDTKHTVKFTAPARTEVVLKTPKIPGLEVRIPKGSVVRDDKGKPVTELGITAIPIDRPPFPLPKNSVVPVYFTVQPGGTYVFPKGAQVIYPNYTHEAPGTRVDFMDYDPEKKGWHVYGHGKVSTDGRQVLPDARTRIWAFHGAMFNITDLLPWDLSWIKDTIDWLSGDPVELGTGMLTDSRTDLAVADPRGSAEITRTYWQGDTHKRAFGIGRDLTYNAFLHSEEQYKEVDLYLPGGAKIHFTRTSPGSGWTDAVFEPLDTPTEFQGSKIVNVDAQWELRFRDGTVWIFPQYAALKEIRDRHGNTIKLTRRDGKKGEITRIDTPGGHWISLDYDADHRVKTATDNTGRTTAYTYDTTGRLETVTDPAGKPSSYTYDGTSNRIATAKDARGITYMTNTFQDGKVKEQVLTEGAKYTFAYTQTGTGKITSTQVTQPGGAVRRVEFDTAGYGVLDTAAYGSSLARKTQFVRGPKHRIDAVVDPYGRRTELTYDANGYVTKSLDLAGTADARPSGTVVYNGPYDQPTKATDPLGNDTLFGYDAEGNLQTATDSEGRKTTLTYAPDGQVETVTDNAGAVSEYTYRNGELITAKDAEGRVSAQFTDAAGRASALTDTAGSLTTVAYDKLNQPRTITDALGQTTGFDYDENGNLTTLTDARNNTVGWAYDNADRPKSTTDAVGAQATFEYDAAGLLKKATSRAGKVATATYDLLGRSKTVQYGVDIAGQAESTVGYDYDGHDLLKQITDSQAGNQTFTYDTYDRPKTVTGPTGTVGYTYDAADRRETMTADGQTTTYGFDKTSILTSVTTGTQTIGFGLDAVGREKTATMPGGISRTTGYDKTGITKSVAYAKGTTPIGDLNYTRDARALQTGLTGTLANVALPAAETATVFGKDNRITTFAGRSFTYDADGQLKSDGIRDYTWDARGQLSGLSKAGQSSTFGYDALGTRSTKTIGGTTDKFLTDGSNPLVEQNGSGDTAATVATSGLDQYLTRSENGSTQVYLTDALGSVIGLANSDGTIATTYAYDPNGTATPTGAVSTNPYTFTGRESDDTGLLYYRNRYYDPETGRFISQDPIGQAGGTNLYQYALSSPTTYTDPTGDNPLIAACAINGAIDGGLNWAFQRLSGRKVSWGDVANAALMGCMLGQAGEYLSLVLATRGAGRVGCMSPNSFTGDTPVLMADGSRKPIKDIKIDDRVQAADPETGEAGPRTVTALIKGQGEKQLVDLIVDTDGTKGTKGTKTGHLTATDGHPFWVPALHEWVEAGDLQPGQWLQTSAGTWVQITATQHRAEAATVYNLTVDGLHTYYVLAGSAPVLVHNCGAARPGLFARVFGQKPNATVADLVNIELPDIGGTADSASKGRYASRLSDSKLLDSVMRPRDRGHLTVGQNGSMQNGNHRAAELIARAAHHARSGRGGISWETPIFIKNF
ncbi:polymorphic toxin-type HINT domain-containing protein [Streptomyces sp. NBC_01463]